MQRRRFIQSAALTGVSLSLPFSLSACRRSASQPPVVVVGAGFAGATAANYLSRWSPQTPIIVIEPNAALISCPQSNLVLSGHRSLDELTHDYQTLKQRQNIEWVKAAVTDIDTEARRLKLSDNSEIVYQRLILAPGVQMDYSEFPAMQQAGATEKIPHAWKAGEQTRILAAQLRAMPTGGTIAITVPRAPYRCPPGPYERACQMAWYLKRHNPRGKLLLLDANPDLISKKDLFVHAWQTHYTDLIEYLPSSEVETVDVAKRRVESTFDQIDADVLNLIPPQKAGSVAALAGVINVDRRWCDVDFRTYESTSVPGVHVIGDSVASKLPKSAHIANAQAKVCAAAVAALLNETPPVDMPVFGNTCYSFTTGTEAGHVAAVYRYDAERAEMRPAEGAGSSARGSEDEARLARGWAENIWADTLR